MLRVAVMMESMEMSLMRRGIQGMIEVGIAMTMTMDLWRRIMLSVLVQVVVVVRMLVTSHNKDLGFSDNV